ncbi:MAG: hypothetical protein WBL61_05615 [Bryobacteraceae bacterium]
MAEAKKDPSAVALGRKGGRKGGPARAAKLTRERRSEIARKAVQVRWAKAKNDTGHKLRQRIAAARPILSTVDHSDEALLSLLKRIRATDNPAEFRRLSDKIARVIFHRQFENA